MNKKPALFYVLQLVLLSFFANAEVHEFTFDNGLKLLVKEDHRAPVVVSQIWYKVGSSYEHDGITGVSHVLEHMMFKGTEKYSPGEFSRIISANGGRENAFTGQDYTAYFQTLEKSRLPISFELEADRMRNLVFLAEEFEKEIKVVKEERRLRTEDRPQGITYETAMATAYQTSPYRHPIVGWMSDLDNMSIKKLKVWYKQWYAPNNATIVVAGDVDAQSVRELAEKYFASLPAADVPENKPVPEVPQKGIKRVAVKRPAEVPYLIMLYKAPVLKTVREQSGEIQPWEPYALDVLAGILDGGGSARFASRLIRGKEIAASAGVSYNVAARLDTTFVISGIPSQGHSTEDLEQALREELTDLQTNLIDEKELERVKAQVVSQDIYGKDSVFYQAMTLGMLETIGLPWHLEEEYVEQIQAVTAEQVQAVAKKYFVDDRLTVATLIPQPMNKQVRAPAVRGHTHAH